MSSVGIESLIENYRTGKATPSQVVEGLLKGIETQNKKLNCFLEMRSEASLKRAKELEARRADLQNLPLYGVPVALKDNILAKDWQATAGSKILKGYISPYSATVTERLESAGAIIIGKTNLDEFAMGSSNENSAFGPVKNPWDIERVPGGSSGGSAAAVAAGLCLGALGTDTGGSVRQPASLCGVVGMKPTYGRVSRYGIVAFGSSLDQVGPLARSSWDCAKLLEIIAGYTGRDSTASKSVVPKYTQGLKTSTVPKNLKVGVYEEWINDGVQPEVRTAFKEMLSWVESNGGKIVPIQLPHVKYALSVYYIIAPSEASSNLARFDGVHYGHRSNVSKSGNDVYKDSRGEGFGKEVKLRIMLGTYALSAGYYEAFYGKANKVRSLIQKDFEEAFKQCDCIFSPTSPTTAFKLGEKTSDPLTMYLSDAYTLPPSIAGLPAISFPCGQDKKNLPIGVQVIGRAFNEELLFQIAHRFEVAHNGFPMAGELSL